MHAMQEDAGSHNHDSGSGANGHADVGSSVNQRKPKGPQMKDTMATMVGMLIPLLTQIGH
jgi:zinc transporter 9